MSHVNKRSLCASGLHRAGPTRILTGRPVLSDWCTATRNRVFS
jgi:hypothetical protein